MGTWGGHTYTGGAHTDAASPLPNVKVQIVLQRDSGSEAHSDLALAANARFRSRRQLIRTSDCTVRAASAPGKAPAIDPGDSASGLLLYGSVMTTIRSTLCRTQARVDPSSGTRQSAATRYHDEILSHYKAHRSVVDSMVRLLVLCGEASWSRWSCVDKSQFQSAPGHRVFVAVDKRRAATSSEGVVCVDWLRDRRQPTWPVVGASPSRASPETFWVLMTTFQQVSSEYRLMVEQPTPQQLVCHLYAQKKGCLIN